MVGTVVGPVVAEPAQTAPATLTSLLDDLEQAANDQNLAAVLALYSPNFSHADGFDLGSYGSALAELWGAYPQLTYDVELLSWEAQGDALVTETATQISGTRADSGREFTLVSEIQSRQRVENGQIVYQEILTEQTRLVTGANPPTVILHIPEQVAAGDRFSFDAIVQEPLGNQRLLGQALDEGVTATDFTVPRPLDLEPLAAGGLFKIGNAPAMADQRWISSVLIRSDGWVIDTRRLNVTD
ncbi:MAG: nuclear transport factor 2 family protein [Cyanobacteria bacterium]|nr:nuclear transport factor 2 family protein [Cyanobacteriota bacterium]